MSFSWYIARRYFFARSTRNAVNIISGISIFGVLVGTLALIIVLSAFNGLETLVRGFYNTFDPDLKVSLAQGKYFGESQVDISKLQAIEGVEEVSPVLEERALLGYRDKEYIATLKGVSENYSRVTRFDEALKHGENHIYTPSAVPHGVMGAGVAYYLGYGRIAFEDPVQVFVPRKNASAANFSSAFAVEQIYPSGIFSVQPDFDEKYFLASLSFVRQLLDRSSALSSIEVKVAEGAALQDTKEALKRELGPRFTVEDRDEQQAVFLKVMRTESLFTFLVFALILSIASFTIMGSLSMMMIEKREHLRTLWAMGTELSTLRAIFFKEGLLIGFVGAGLGLLSGVVLVLLQQHYGLISLGASYVVNSYPVELRWIDVLIVMSTVALICGATSWLTAQRLTARFISKATD